MIAVMRERAEPNFDWLDPGFECGGTKHVLDGPGLDDFDGYETQASAAGVRVLCACSCGGRVRIDLGHADVLACVALGLGGAPETWLPPPETGAVAGVWLVPTEPQHRHDGPTPSYVSLLFRCICCNARGHRRVPVPHEVIMQALVAAYHAGCLLDVEVVPFLIRSASSILPNVVKRWSKGLVSAADGFLSRVSGKAERVIEKTVRKAVEQAVQGAMWRVQSALDRTVERSIGRSIKEALQESEADEPEE